MARSVSPATFAISVVFNDAAPDGMRAVAATYWRLAGENSTTGMPVWEVRTSQIDFELWGPTAGYAAAAGATATLESFACSACGGPLTLTSRQIVNHALGGRDVKCRACEVNTDIQATRLLNPSYMALRTSDPTLTSKEVLERLPGSSAIPVPRTAKRLAIEKAYPVYEVDEDDLPDATLGVFGTESFEAALGALSLLRGGKRKDGLMTTGDYSEGRIAPVTDATDRLVTAAWNEGLILPYPSSPFDAFSWDDATLGDAIYPDLVRWYAVGRGEMTQRADDLDKALCRVLHHDALWGEDRALLRRWAKSLLTHEAAKFFAARASQFELGDLGDPALENHQQLMALIEEGLAVTSLGHLYRFAWFSARDTSVETRRSVGMPRGEGVRDMLTGFARRIHDAAMGEANGEPFSENRKEPLSAATRVLFNVGLELDPMTATLAEVDELLARRDLLARCEYGIRDREEIIATLRTNSWDGYDFRQMLAVIEDEPPHIHTSGCVHEGLASIAREAGVIFDRVVSRIGPTDAAIVTAESTSMANLVNSVGRVGAGDALLEIVLTDLGFPSEPHIGG